MSEEVEFVPTSLDVVMGGEVDDAPEVTEPEAVEVEKEPEVAAEEETPNSEPEAEPVKADEADNFAKARDVMKTQKARIAELEAGQAVPEKVPDVFEDQEAYTAHLEQKFDNKLLDMSEEMVREQFDDYEDMKARVFKEAETNPAIRGNITGQNIALSVYREGKRLIRDDVLKDPEYEVKVEARLRAKIEAEMQGKEVKGAEDKKALEESLPDDLTSESSTGNRPKEKGFTPTTLDNIFPD